ncbi:MAG: DUF5671 domain-containing protein [bacterium]|nr:DUF5671 domain-containing protein [bacterium]
MDTNIKSTPKDVFLHILSIGTLYYVAVNFITLIWQYINIYFPDQLQPEYFSGYAGTIRFAMASLIIVYPVHCYVMRLLYRDYAAIPEKRELRVRKWLVHFTLFVTAIVIIGDLVTLVYNFLGGELTVRFALKIVTVFLTTGAIFMFYLRDLKNKWNEKSLRLFVGAIIAIILVAVIGGFFTAGSPLRARLYRFDERRVNDLQMTQGQIIYYWQSKGKLPQALADLEDPISGFRAPTDPSTVAIYEYRTTGELAFELCAAFDLPSTGAVLTGAVKPRAVYEPYGANWDHDAGRVCFTRVIDPQFYPVLQKEKFGI